MKSVVLSGLVELAENGDIPLDQLKNTVFAMRLRDFQLTGNEHPVLMLPRGQILANSSESC